MISENCSIHEFVESVKGKETWEVITLAVEEATRADRMYYHTCHDAGEGMHNGLDYSRQLKRLINYLRFEVKPRRPGDTAYCLYEAHWGQGDYQCPELPSEAHFSTIH
jgi:hypothetical protein